MSEMLIRSHNLLSRQVVIGSVVLSFSVAVDPGDAAAQTQNDSVQIALAAWDSFLGSPPFEHPGGETSRVCPLPDYPTGALADSVALGAPTDSVALGALIGQVTAALRSRPDLIVSNGCQGVETPTFGSWIVDAQESPAVIVIIGMPVFATDGTGQIRIGAIRGGRWARVAMCSMRRSDSEWKVSRCTTVMQS